MNKEQINEGVLIVKEDETREKTFFENTKEWFKKHKTALLVVGGVTLAAALAYVLKQVGASEETIAVIIEPLQTDDLVNQVKQMEIKRAYTVPQEPVYTKMHPRTLPIGQHASQRKLDEAAALGIILADNQTLVDGYPRYN